MEKYPKKRAYVRGKLKKFLDKKGVTKLFIKNCKKQCPECRNVKNILSAFIWSHTDQGNKLWKKLSDEFEGLNE